MEFTKLDAVYRIRSGKGVARRLRQNGRVPAVIYGQGIEATTISVVPGDLKKKLSGPLRTNTILNLQIEGGPKDVPKEVTVLVTDHQFEPVGRDLLHVDFITVDPNKKITVQVPIELTGRSAGVLEGGVRSVHFRTIPIECMPADIPVSIVHDVTEMVLNSVLTVAELDIPDNVTVALPGKTTVCAIIAKRGVEEEEETTEGEGEGEGEGEAAAAADAKPAAE